MFESIASIGMMTICMTILYYLSHLIYNNVKAQQQYAIRQGQGGRNGNIMCYASANIEIIRNTRESIKRSFDLVRSAREEVLRIFSSITAFRHQVRVGVLHLFKESIERGVKVRVLIPSDYQQITQITNEVNLVLPDLFIRCVDKSLQNTIGILVIDRKESLIIETKDDTKDNPYEATGLGAYSDSKAIALSLGVIH